MRLYQHLTLNLNHDRDHELKLGSCSSKKIQTLEVKLSFFRGFKERCLTQNVNSSHLF